MGMTYWGVTTLNSVTGTHKLAQKYIIPKTKRAFTGVGSKECNDVLQQHLIPEGKRLFQQAGRRADKWKLQQGNAPPRKTCNASETMSQEGSSWNGPLTHLICLPLKISGLGWSSSWGTERVATILMTRNVG